MIEGCEVLCAILRMTPQARVPRIARTAGSTGLYESPSMQLGYVSSPPPAASPSPGDLVDEKEPSAILGCAVQTHRNYRWRNGGPRWKKVGKRMVRYFRSDLAAFIEAGGSSERMS